MVERPRVDLVSLVARIKRGPVDKDDAAEAEVAVDVLDFLDHACKATGCEPGWTAKLTVLDLCAAIVGFGAARDVNELVQWLREEVPGRARELTKAVANSSKGGRFERRAAVFVPMSTPQDGELALRRKSGLRRRDLRILGVPLFVGERLLVFQQLDRNARRRSPQP